MMKKTPSYSSTSKIVSPLNDNSQAWVYAQRKLTFNSQSILKELEKFYKSLYAMTDSNASEETFSFFFQYRY